jgi:putative nucleotidyltransferase with HDIG domain
MKRERHSLNLELMPSRVPEAVAFHALRWGMLAGLALLTYLMYPVVGGLEIPNLQAGEVAQEEIIAPFAFDVPKSAPEIAAERLERASAAMRVYDFRGDIVDSVLARTDSLFGAFADAESADQLAAVGQNFGLRLSVEEAEYLAGGRRLAAYRDAVRRLVSRELRRGVVASGQGEAGTTGYVRLRRNGSESAVPLDSLLTEQALVDRRTAYSPDLSSSVGDMVFTKLLQALVEPTWVPNEAEFEARRQELAVVDSVKYRVRADERIIDANEVVTRGAEERLFALRQELLNRGGGTEGRLSGVVGQVLTNALVLVVFWALLQLYRPMIYENQRQMLVLSVAFALVILSAAATEKFISPAPELIPVPFAAMLITAMFRGRVAMVGAMVLAVLLGTQAAYGGADAIFIALLGGVAAAVSVRNVRRRDQFLLAAGVVAGAYLFAGLAVKLRVEGPITEVALIGLRGGLNAVASAALVSTLLPAFESIGGISTDLTLLELSDPDRPLLRRLATEAPGTYAHSIAIANLCESASKAVGGHGLLARVGCYYHDIGKVRKPQYFVENQAGASNPHDKLKPEVSAGIVRNHVRDGLQLADEHKLPQEVKAFIAEHHGTMEISYFLDRARHRNGGEEVNLEEFRYPGPKPQSVETAISMLADGVEAAVRVLEDPTPDKVRDVIDHIVNQRVDAGQLEEAPITLAQLSLVREEFARAMGGALHNRIDYPATAGGIGAEWEARSDA